MTFVTNETEFFSCKTSNYLKFCMNNTIHMDNKGRDGLEGMLKFRKSNHPRVQVKLLLN